MGILEDLEKHIVSLSRIHDDGVPSVSMAFLDESGDITSHVITGGKQNGDTLYQACSISKAITGLAIAKLVDMGKISYDDKIIDHIPQDRLAMLGGSESDINLLTIAALVSHRSGLSQHGFPGYVDDDFPTKEDILRGRSPANTPRIRFSSFPFAQASYSGGGFVLLEMFLEQVLDKSFPEIMHDIVLGPLQMTRSHYNDLSPEETNYAKAFATAHQPAIKFPRGYHYFPESAAAGLWTTPTDLLRAISAIQNSLNRNDGFLSQETARKMITKVVPNSDLLSMALGWGADNCFFAHSGGNDPGYATYVMGSHGGVVNQEDSSAPLEIKGGFAIMTNAVLGFDTIRKIMAALFFVNDWPLVPSLPCGFPSMTDFVPYTAPAETNLDDAWKGWIREWKGGWAIENTGGLPHLSFRAVGRTVQLRPAAIPVRGSDGTRQLVLVAENYQLAVRFLLSEGQQHLQIIRKDGAVVFEREEQEPNRVRNQH